jgi:hypothetical protein
LLTPETVIISSLFPPCRANGAGALARRREY